MIYDGILLNQIIEEIKKANNIIMSLHRDPDPDSACSCLAMSNILKKLNKKFTILSPGKIPEDVAKIYPELAEIQFDTDIINHDLSTYDLFIGLDTSLENRFSNSDDFKLPKTLMAINIDHHYANTLWGRINHVDSSLYSACSVLTKLFKEIGLEITPYTANYLLLGIISDSINFQALGVSPDDLELTAYLIRNGGDMYHIFEKINLNNSYDSIKLNGIGSLNLQLATDKHYGYSLISFEDLQKYRINLENKYNPIVSYLRTLKDVDFVFTITQWNPEFFKINLRSKSSRKDVSKIAKALGGGGHTMAAAVDIKSKKSIHEILNLVIKTIENLNI